MKKLLCAFTLIGLVGCDNPPAVDSTPSIASMIASGTEERTTQCVKGDVSLVCEFLSGDLLGSGKWHHAKVFISKQGQVDITVDGEKFYQTGVESGFYQGENVGTFKFKGLNNSIAQVEIRNSNTESRLSLDVWNSKNQKYMTANN